MNTFSGALLEVSLCDLCLHNAQNTMAANYISKFLEGQKTCKVCGSFVDGLFVWVVFGFALISCEENSMLF